MTLGASLKVIVERMSWALWFPGEFANFECLISCSCQANRGERATIISRQSPRKSSQRTGTAPPLCANFSYGQKALGLATNKRSHGRYQARVVHACVLTRADGHACAFSFVRIHAPPISIRAQTSPMPARVLEVIPYHRRTHGTVCRFRWRGWRRAGTGVTFNTF